MTDAIAFAANSASPIVAIGEYGVFVAFLLMLNFALVVVTFPLLHCQLSPASPPTYVFDLASKITPRLERHRRYRQVVAVEWSGSFQLTTASRSR